MTGPKYIICDNPDKTVTDAVTGLEVRANPYSESLFVPDYVDPETSGFPTDTIIEPTQAQKLLSLPTVDPITGLAVKPTLLQKYTSYCSIKDNNDGSYFVEYYITKKLKGKTEYIVSVNLFNKAGPGRCCSPRHGMPFRSRHVDCVSMTRLAMCQALRQGVQRVGDQGVALLHDRQAGRDGCGQILRHGY